MGTPVDRHHLLLAMALSAAVAMPAQGTIDEARAKGLKWLVQIQKGDGSFIGE
jgi:hypothetical protein